MATKSSLTLPPFDELMNDPGIEIMVDAQMLAAYVRQGHDAPPLAMATGDPYLLGATLPAGLAAWERKAPKYFGGYSRTPAGIPEARRTVLDVTVRGQQLDRHAVVGKDFDMHLTPATGTRGIIRDFGRYVLATRPKGEKRTPVILCATPAWDYAGALSSLGFSMRFWPLRPENGWLPAVADAEAALRQIDANPNEYLALVIVNAQHNPTGRSWPADVLRSLYGAATSRGAAILLDDPYYFVVTDTAKPASAPAVLFEHLADKKTPKAAAHQWCRVQSFGKTFVCNNWGIGSVMAHPDTLRVLGEYLFEWAFPREGARQWAMARWLADPACEKYLAGQRKALGNKRRMWAEALQTLGWPPELTAVGEATPYFLMAVPPAYLAKPDGVIHWRQVLLDEAGLLFSHASIEQEGTDADAPFLRAYLGGSEAIVAEAIRRLTRVGVRYAG